MSLIHKTAAELGALIAAGEVSAVEVAQAHLDRIAAVEPQVNAFLHVDAETTLEQARAVDARRAAGEDARPAGRRADRAQGRLHHRGHADHGRVQDP